MEVYLENKLHRGLEQVRRVLETTRTPQLAGDVHHQYDDKYVLAEVMTSAAVASSVGLLRRLGLTEEGLRSLREWGAKRTVTLRLKAEETCKFKEKKKRDVEAATKNVTEVSGLGRLMSVTNKNVTTVTEYFWDVTASYAVTAYCGNDPTTAVELLRRGGATVVMTNTEGSPHPATSSREPVEVEVGWLLRQLNERNQAHFQVDRSAEGCHTPRRNGDVEEAMRVLSGLAGWCGRVAEYFQSHLWGMEQLKGAELDLADAARVDTVMVPVVPLLENLKGRSVPAVEGSVAEPPTSLVVLGSAAAAAADGSLSLSAADIGGFLREEERALDEKCAALAKVFPEAKGLVLRADAQAVAALRHGQEVVQTYLSCVNYLERLLRNQLIAAIGKEVTSQDFGDYMRFHNRKLFAEGYGPAGFSYAVRRPEHYPEGVLSIEEARPDGSMTEPIATVVRRVSEPSQMRFSLSASATATFSGDVFVHSYVGHRFSHEPLSKLAVAGRARQFSGFVLLLGRIGGPGLFLPSHAMLIQNKDDFRIPLLLEEIPTPKEFQDAIESLSPEQQRFAKAYRSMQLESTLFAMCVVQIKPQLEKVLNLPEDALTKEIKLTQDLLELFVKYQIPSDLLSWKCDVFVDPADVPVKEKIDAVKGHVAAMQEMLKDSKEKEIEEASLEYKYAHGGLPPPPPPGCPVPAPVPRGAGAMPPMAMMAQCAPMPMSMPMPVSAPPPPMPGGVLKKHAAPKAATAAVPKPAPTPPKPGAETAQSTPQGRGEEEEPSEVSGFDVSQIPHLLEKKYAELDEDSALRPTIINIGKSWEKEHQEGLLSKPTKSVLGVDEQKAEKDKAFDLLDALTKSGVVPIDDATLHVVVTATHCFDKTLMDTVVQKSVNPVEKLERSVLIVATTIHDKPAEELVKGPQRERVKTYSPKLFLQ